VKSAGGDPKVVENSSPPVYFTLPPEGRAVMANDWKYYLRFVDRQIFGESKYRPSEGWIDLLSDTYPGERTGDVELKCGRDRAVPHILQANATGMNVGAVELEVRLANVWWVRFKMTDVYVTATMLDTYRFGSKLLFTLHYSDCRLSPGMLAPVP
jgi:hypothetical protein